MVSETSAGIPDKKYFKIGEVCQLVGVKQHVLRYWESEFPAIRPHRAASNQRLYRKVDVEIILTIKKLLKEKGLTIIGAKKYLENTDREKAANSPKHSIESKKVLFKDIKQELVELKKILEG